jgi:hypothetical protein
MASDHITADELVAYQSRALAPDALLRVSDHLAECAECRGRIRMDSASIAVVNLSYEELVEYLDGDIDPLRRRELSEKLERSSQSRAELEDLRKFRDETTALVPDVDGKILIFPRAITRWALPLAAAIAVAAAALWWSTNGREADSAITLRDGNRSISLEGGDHLDGLSGIPDELLPAVATAMRTGKLEIPAEIRSLAGDRAVLAGEPNELSEFRVIAPVATAVRESMPRFCWHAGPGADHYRIRVVDAQNGEVIVTGESNRSQTEWTPAKPLETGKVYQWQVEALRDNEVIARAPVPPEPEARFKVLSKSELLKVESISQSAAGGSHLAMAVADARAGLLDEAAEQLAILKKENPDGKIPTDLLVQIEVARCGRSNR